MIPRYVEPFCLCTLLSFLIAAPTESAVESWVSHCAPPPTYFLEKLPRFARSQIRSIWNEYDNKSDCAAQLALTRTVILHLTPMNGLRENATKGASVKRCAPPAIFYRLPKKLRLELLEVWRRYNASQGCALLRHRARILLLNQPLTVRNSISPPKIPCGEPHFISRLNPELQSQIRSIWVNYKKGLPCQQELRKEIGLLTMNNVALESFFIPPPMVMRRLEVNRKVVQHFL